jgi:hypothetical protein
MHFRAEGVGFEPTMRRKPHSGFQDRRHRPLGEPSRPCQATQGSLQVSRVLPVARLSWRAFGS